MLIVPFPKGKMQADRTGQNAPDQNFGGDEVFRKKWGKTKNGQKRPKNDPLGIKILDLKLPIFANFFQNILK